MTADDLILLISQCGYATAAPCRLGDSVRAIVPLFETEIRGVPMLQRLCDAIFAADGAKTAPSDHAASRQEVGAAV